jgi:hypothetical protein
MTTAPSIEELGTVIVEAEEERLAYVEARDRLLGAAKALVNIMGAWLENGGEIPDDPELRNAFVRVINARNEVIAGVQSDCPRGPEIEVTA